MNDFLSGKNSTPGHELQQLEVNRPGTSLGAPTVDDRSSELLREAVIVTDRLCRIVDWNASASRIYGYEREEALGRDLGGLIVPEHEQEQHRRRFQGLLGSRSSLLDAPFEMTGMRSTGELVRTSARITRTTTVPPNLIFFIRDVSDIDSWELNHRQLETIVDSSEDAMATLTVDGTITTWNPAAAELCGYSAEEAVGRRLASLLVTAESMQEPEEELLGEVAAGRPVERDTCRLHKDGSELRLSLRMLPVRDGAQRVVGSVLIARHVMDRRHREERERRDAQKRLWQLRIEEALAKRLFVFAAQPVIDLRSGAVDHYELLLRMKLGSHLAMPDEFLPHAEDSGQIHDIDLWAVRRGIELAARHRVAINISGASIADEELHREVRRQLCECDVAPGRLIFEITETAAAEDLERAARLVGELRTAGCEVALDDFGTGFGSFTYLNRLPVSELKIDREFIARLGGSEINQRVVKAIGVVGRSFDMKVVAEGVEDEVERSVLRDLGVDFAQGYLFGRPAVIDDAWLAPDR